MMKKFKDLQKKKGKKGFSMIELIIVIAIMAILIALIGTQLIPYLEKSRQSKDLTTLDTCLTNFQAALARGEVSTEAVKGKSADGIAKLGDFSAAVKTEYESLSGKYKDDTTLNGAFKSDAASSGNVIFGVDDTGECYVKKGTLKASPSESGVDEGTTSGTSSGTQSNSQEATE